MSGFSFGTPNNQASTSKFGFSTPNPQSSSTTNLFGQSTSTPAQGTSLFGAQQTPQQPTTSGLFGQTNTQTPGQSSTGSGLFGSVTQQQPTTQQGGGLFGQQSSGSGLFGAKPATGGLFGQTQQPSTSGGLFGQPAQQQQQQQQQQQGGLFGSTAQPAQTSGLFGSTNQPAQTSGLFGSTAQPQQQGGLFGSTTQPQQQNGLFGSAAQPQQGGLFGSAPQQQPQQPNSLGFSTKQLSQSSALVPGQMQKQEPDIENRIRAIYDAWNTQSPSCRFTYFFYNVVDPGTAGQYGRPAAAADEAKWQRAVRDNPDPENMVPVLATGWGDVKKRVQMQENVASVHQQRIKEINGALSNLTRQATLSSSIRLQNLQATLKTLQTRLIHLAALTPQFIPALQSSNFTPAEAATRSVLEGVQAELDGRSKASTGTPNRVGFSTGGGGRKGKKRMVGEVNELWGLVDEVRRLKKLRQATGGEWSRDEKALADVAEVLAAQQTALSKLSQVVNDDLFDAEVIRTGLSQLSTSEQRA